MNQNILILTAALLGFVHTVFGPDYYIPFIAISKAKNWTFTKTLVITVLCGIGHILGSIALGLIGVFSGIVIANLKLIESFRGTVAAYLLILFGLFYTIYGLRKAYRNKPHKHLHLHEDGTIHERVHVHKKELTHIHENIKKNPVSPWVLFIIFVFGPCEVLIPFFMFEAAKHSYGGAVVVSLVFGVVTIATMLGVVFLGVNGVSFVKLNKLERYSHAIGGAMILICGLLIMLGL